MPELWFVLVSRLGSNFSDNTEGGHTVNVNVKKLNIEYAFIQIFYWMGFCICINFAAVFLQGRGYSNSELGLILALGNVSGFLASPYLAQLVDKGILDVFRCLWLLMTVQIAMLVVFILVPGKGLLLSLLYCGYIACNATVNVMNTHLSFEMDGWTGQINYGAARGLGCIGYAPMAVLLGRLAVDYSSDISPYAAIIVIALQLITLFIVRAGIPGRLTDKRHDSGNRSPSTLSAFGFLRLNRSFCFVLMGLCCLYFTHSLSTSFLINIVRSIGHDAKLSGALSGFMAVVELPTMLLYSRIEKRVSCKALLCFASVMFVVKALLLALVVDVSHLYIAASIHSLSYALLTPAIVHYLSLVVNKADSAKAQALAFSMSSLGYAFACGFGGMLYDSISVRSTLLTGVAICTLGALTLIRAIAKASNTPNELRP